MSWMQKMILGGMLKMDKAGGEGGGGGSGTGGEGGKGGAGEGGKGSGAGGGDDVAALRAANKALEDRLAKLEAAGNPAGGKKTGEEDPDLADKARKEADAKAKGKDESKKLEAAIHFNLTAKEWVKTHASILPTDVEGIFAEAEKETYDSAIEKDCAIKSGLIKTFFALQSNLDLLTSSQKSAIEEFLKLTKNGKQDKAQQIYDSIFEPTFEALKRIEKAKQLQKSGHSDPTDADKAYKEKMVKLSRKHYMGEKDNAGRN